MMAEIIDLDDALPPDKKVRIHGEVYSLPGDIPTELFLRIQRATGQIQEDDGIDRLYQAVLDLFKERDPAIESLPLGLTQIVTLFSTVYGVQGEDDERPPQTRGTATGSSRSKTRSRS